MFAGRWGSVFREPGKEDCELHWEATKYAEAEWGGNAGRGASLGDTRNNGTGEGIGEPLSGGRGLGRRGKGVLMGATDVGEGKVRGVSISPITEPVPRPTSGHNVLLATEPVKSC